ncbi:MAG TPA: 2Fe-2S iron-sulfur cluster-binding protein [Polaromonas sp.]|uniref:2Fe-2S iron-sulfur cluster-binding protein n=1 Tax=Polaromonas sp. TaxID=1869339 RepID=UPI002D2475B5|nr:2Fe-2S iron-sulfur cluster-binding protein [Polaromonas sp.]HYW58012.1 2Fe-2S iron-sulfur cluster-binding protein [Polaromonas sp.]
MITINFIAANGDVQRAEGRIGKSLMEAAVASGIEGIAADCGGLMTCATCHVFVREPFSSLLPPADGEEQSMLAFTATPKSPSSRLSCQIKLSTALDGLTVELPASQY